MLQGQVNKCIWRMPRRLQAMKDVVVYENFRGAGKQALIRKCPNGETHPQGYLSLNTQETRGEPSELKHLSNSRKRNQPRFRQQWRAKSEQPVIFSTCVSRTEWKVRPQRVIAPYTKTRVWNQGNDKQGGTREILSEHGGTILQG